MTAVSQDVRIMIKIHIKLISETGFMKFSVSINQNNNNNKETLDLI